MINIGLTKRNLLDFRHLVIIFNSAEFGDCYTKMLCSHFIFRTKFKGYAPDITDTIMRNGKIVMRFGTELINNKEWKILLVYFTNFEAYNTHIQYVERDCRIYAIDSIL